MINNFEKNIFDAIEIIVQERLKGLTFNRYIEGRVLQINPDGTINVDYCQQTLKNLHLRAGLTVEVGDIVYICIPNNNFSFLWVDCVRPYNPSKS